MYSYTTLGIGDEYGCFLWIFMILDNLKLLNFRNYDLQEIKFDKKMNILIGNNGEGKTNILESIIILALTKSFRNREDVNLIKFGKLKTKIQGKVKTGKTSKNLAIDITEGGKKLFINKKEIRRLSDYISNLNIIVFTPEDLNIIKGAPSLRRNLLNIELSQLSKKYLNTYNEYNKILKTRNEYLKLLFTSSVADKKYLDILTDKLIEKAVIIIMMRNNYIKKINESISNIYKEISKSDDLIVKYVPNVEFNEYTEEKIGEELRNIYQKNYLKELNNKMTLYGPHRDDLEFYIKEKNLKFFSSQGQQRLAIISYKLSEIAIFEEKLGTTPVLLFDDIFSELDLKKRNRLLEFLNKDIQSIITTTDVKNINKKYLTQSTIFEIKNGNLIRKKV